MRTVTLYEHETALVAESPGDDEFSVTEIEALDRIQKGLGVEAFRWVARNRVRSAQYVGVLASNGARLEVLPKIDRLGVGETRNALVRMLATAYDLTIWDGEITALDFQNRDLLEILMGLFARRLQNQVRAGLSREYRRYEGDLARLRGKMNVPRQFTILSAYPHKLACRFDEFTADTALNRLLLCAVKFLLSRTARASTQRTLSEIVGHFEDVQPTSVGEALAQEIIIDRSNRKWAPTITLAKLLLSAIYQTTHSGAREGVALVFDMNQLFESYVATLARRVCPPRGYRIRTQGPQGWLAYSQGEKGAFRTKPDMHIEGNGHVLVLDTKWKTVDPERPNFDVTQGDAYQMHGYARVYGSEAVILLYPHHDRMLGPPGLQTTWRFRQGNSSLSLATIDLAKPADCSATLLSILDETVGTQSVDCEQVGA